MIQRNNDTVSNTVVMVRKIYKSSNTNKFNNILNSVNDIDDNKKQSQ